MDTLPWIATVVALSLLVGALPLFFWLIRRPARVKPLPTEWALTARPVFSADERRVYKLMRDALPHHIVLSKLPLVRFCQPSDPNEVHYWYDLLGSINVTFAVCSANGRVLAAIDLDTDRGNSRRILQIKQSVLGACRVRYLRCPVDNLPSAAELQLLVPSSTAASRGPQPAAMASSDLDEARDTLSSTVANRRAQRSALWQDSSLFQDSFFAPDSRLDSFGSSEFAGLPGAAFPPGGAGRNGASGFGNSRLPRHSRGDDDEVGAVVVDSGQRERAALAPLNSAPPASTGSDRAAPYAELTPGAVLDALDGVGLRGDGRLIQLNSYENRVFQAFLEDGRVVVAKFYRPARWSDAQILEEHDFAGELATSEIPVAAPLVLEPDVDSPHGAGIAPIGATLASVSIAGHDYRFGACARFAGRAPELEEPGVLAWLGRYIGRLHAVGRRRLFAQRLCLDVASYGGASRDWLLANRLVSPDSESTWRDLAETALRACDAAFAAAGATSLRLHGDCHLGNVLWTERGPHFVDLDDAVNGPAIQDLWMLLSGDRTAMSRQLQDVLDGYEAFQPFDRKELGLIEPLRTLRMLHHSAWIARRWDDPAFPIAFPWFASPSYWAEQCTRLREQLVALDEPPPVA